MNIFNFIKTQVPILEVIQQYTTLKKAGIYWRGICPFHHERTPSFTVTPHKDIFYCFGCHQGGDLIAFVERIEQCPPLEAAQQLIVRYGLQVPEAIAPHEHKRGDLSTKNSYHALCQLMARWCTEQVARFVHVQNYIAQRNITTQSIKDFSIGYFPTGSKYVQEFIDYVYQEHYLTKDLIDAHLIREGKQGLHSPFENRIIFPIRNHQGLVCGFGGRIFQPQDTRAKYYNSQDNPFFTKGSLVFGLDQAKRAIQESGVVFLVEGYIDCIAMVQAGYKNTVATLGTACSRDILILLSRYAQKLYITYDGDAAGINAAIRLIEFCWEINKDMFVIELPEKEDPASFLRCHTNLDALITQAKDILIWYIDRLYHNFSSKTLTDRVKAVRDILSIVARSSDAIQQNFLLQKIAAHTSIPHATLQQELDNLTGKKPANSRTVSQKRPSGGQPVAHTKLEIEIFGVILNTGIRMDNEDEDLVKKALPKPLGAIFEKFQRFRQNHVLFDFSAFFTTLDADEQRSVNTLLIKSAGHHNDTRYQALLVQLKKRTWKSTVHEVQLKLARAQQLHQYEEVQNIITEFQALKQKMLQKGLL